MKTLAPLIALSLAAGCASSPPPAPAAPAKPKPPTMRETVDGLVSMLETARTRLQSTVSKLARVVEGPSGDLPADFAAFDHELSALQVDVDWVRRAAMDLALRRDQYLELWIKKTSDVATPEIREQAERRRAALMSNFMDLKGKGDAVRQSFAPLMSRLLDSARFLGAELTRRSAGSLSEELQVIRRLEAEVLVGVEEYRKTMAGILAKIPIGD